MIRKVVHIISARQVAIWKCESSNFMHIQVAAREQVVHAQPTYVLGWPSMLLEALARQIVHVQGRYPG
jgi:hypothetical protein